MSSFALAEAAREVAVVGSAVPLYLDLLKKSLTRSLFDQTFEPKRPQAGTWKARVFPLIERTLQSRRLVLTREFRSEDVFSESPPQQIRTAETLIGPIGIENIQHCVEDVLANDVPGDLIEAGVWRGGAAIFMRGALAAHGATTRTVWAADSFAGLPSPDITLYEEDAGDEKWASESWLAIPLEVVKENFARYGLLDDQVRFLVGWFHQTLPNAPIEQLALIRLDGDMYGSTMDALRNLYPKLSVGGYVIVDDYWLPKCRAAVDRYRADNNISDEIKRVDRAIVYWQRTS